MGEQVDSIRIGNANVEMPGVIPISIKYGDVDFEFESLEEMVQCFTENIVKKSVKIEYDEESDTVTVRVYKFPSNAYSNFAKRGEVPKREIAGIIYEMRSFLETEGYRDRDRDITVEEWFWDKYKCNVTVAYCSYKRVKNKFFSKQV